MFPGLSTELWRPHALWPSLTTNGSALMISNWVCGVWPLPSAPGARVIAAESTQRPGAPESASLSLSSKPQKPYLSGGRAKPPRCLSHLRLPGFSQDLSSQATRLPEQDCPQGCGSSGLTAQRLLLPQPPFWKLRAHGFLDSQMSADLPPGPSNVATLDCGTGKGDMGAQPTP